MLKENFRNVLLGLSILFFTGLFVSEASAYIDPGTGSALIQVLIGVVAGVGITLKLYWFKIKEKLFRK